MDKEQVKKKKKIILISSITIATLILIVGISYAFWQTTKLQNDTNIIASGCFGVELEGNEAINISSAYPLNIEEGMKGTPYTFTITNTCSGSANYIVNLESLSTTTFESSSIRVALDDTNKLYSEYEESNKYYSDSKEARTLISGELESSESITYNLRMWIDENASNSEQNKVFASKIVVTSGQEGAGIDPEITDLNATSTIDTINITYQANGDISTTCKYGIEVGTYDNEVADATNTNCNIGSLSENTTYYYQICTETGKGNKCVDGNIKTKIPLSKRVEIGDYISMTPTSTSYIPLGEDTGCVKDKNCQNNTLNPSELNLWRVIRKNYDGTVDVVSEYVSSVGIIFYGKTGYMNLVGGLNTIASQYTNSKYVQSTRHMGYSTQVLTCSSLEECSSDVGHQTDLDLVNVAYGGSASCVTNCSGLIANKVGTATAGSYWLTARYHGNDYFGQSINNMGSLQSGGLLGGDGVSGSNGSTKMIRPILTLKSTIDIVSGDGQSVDTAYAFE